MNYYIKGDLNQTHNQKRYLEKECRGFKLSSDNGLTYFLDSKDEFNRAICCIWHDKVDGFWNYKNELIEIEEITEVKFYEVLHARAILKQ
jgi:hypothetical protein